MTTPTHPNHVTNRQGFPCTSLRNLLPFPALLHLFTPRGHYCTSDLFQGAPPQLLPSHFPLETSHQMPPAPRSNSRTDGSMAILFWVTFQKLFQGTDSHRQSRVSKQDEPRGGGWFDTNLSSPSQQVTLKAHLELTAPTSHRP